jgi:hypothetical protein
MATALGCDLQKTFNKLTRFSFNLIHVLIEHLNFGIHKKLNLGISYFFSAWIVQLLLSIIKIIEFL